MRLPALSVRVPAQRPVRCYGRKAPYATDSSPGSGRKCCPTSANWAIPWNMDKDGKGRFDPMASPKLLRKGFLLP